MKKIVLCLGLALLTMLVGCAPPDMHSKYLMMKGEANWIISQCSVANDGLKIRYNGKRARIKFECNKPKAKMEWKERFASLLADRGYRHIRDGYPPIAVYCLKNTGIVFHYEEDNLFKFIFDYPSSAC